MRSSILLVGAILALAGSHDVKRAAGLPVPAVRVAYQDAIERYDGGRALQRSNAPQRTQPTVAVAAPSGWRVRATT